ncbi:hypothetical protein QOZ80_9BG0708900 [Eleusine coracana subsp. coracana]|nr:hypothetical protein QOZ80_9BG0708900 [Eleusine coracana subsp. coracana]
MESAIAGAGARADDFPDWTLLPEDFLVTLMGELDIPNLIRAGAVCAPWHSAYATFRRLRLPSPRQPPCLLYSCDALESAAALYCPSTGANFQIPLPQLRGLSPIGSAHGWLVVADEVGNLHLMNPLTGGRVALPPITTLRGVEEGTTFDEDDNLAYNFHQTPGDSTLLAPIPVSEAADCTYDRAILSCAPSSAGGRQEMASRASGRATSTAMRHTTTRTACSTSIYALDLNGPSPVVRMIIPELRLGGQPYRYLIHAPWGELLQAWRFRKLHEPPTLLVFPPDVDDYDPSVEHRTGELQLYRVDRRGQRLVKLEEGLGHHALSWVSINHCAFRSQNFLASSQTVPMLWMIHLSL